jgi:uncharacterized membrane protein
MSAVEISSIGSGEKWMDDIVVARVLHLLALVHWIGGVAFVTMVVLPAVARMSDPSRRMRTFEQIEGRFSFHARFSVTLAGLSGFYMTFRIDGWYRFADPQFWWMPAMVLVWALFTFVLFVAEPAFLHAWFRRRAQRDQAGTFALLQLAHWVLLALSAVTLAGAALGAHGVFF